MRQRNRYHRRGANLVAVLGVSTIVAVIGLAALLEARIERRVINLAQDAGDAGLLARSVMELALFWITTNPTWRARYQNDTWTEEYAIGSGSCTFKLVDEQDGDLADDSTQPVRLYAMATVQEAVRIYSVLLEPDLGTNLLSNGDMEIGTTHWTGEGLWGDCDLDSYTDEPHGGAAYIWVKNRDHQYTGPNQDVTDKLTNGATYYTEVWIKGEDSENYKTVGIDMNTSTGNQWVEFDASWVGTDWVKVSGTLAVQWTGTLEKAYWRVYTPGDDEDFKIDDAMFLEGEEPPGSTMMPVAGTWRRETLAGID